MLRTIKGRWGDCTYFAKDINIGGSLRYYGEFSPDETETIISLASDLCLDIGSNIGCIGQALEYSGFKVMAFEPQPEVYRVMRMNIKGEAHNVALGAKRGVAEMPKVYYSEKGNCGMLGLGMRSIYGSYPVEVRSLDSYAINERVGLMKIDVEGSELAVLQGAVGIIGRDRPILYIEDDRPENSKKLREFIVGLGYTIEDHVTNLYRENNFFGHKKNIWDQNYGSFNIICRPC